MFLSGVRPIGFQQTVNFQVDKPIAEPFGLAKDSLVAELQPNTNGAAGLIFWRDADLNPIEIQVLEPQLNQGANRSRHITVSGVGLC